MNEAIGILLRSYTRAINIERNRKGSLFRQRCKAKDGWLDEFATVSKHKSAPLDKADYGFQLFNYIHKNPVKAGLVENAIDYPWSSAKDYAGLRKGSLCDIELGKRILKFL